MRTIQSVWFRPGRLFGGLLGGERGGGAGAPPAPGRSGRRGSNSSTDLIYRSKGIGKDEQKKQRNQKKTAESAGEKPKNSVDDAQIKRRGCAAEEPAGIARTITLPDKARHMPPRHRGERRRNKRRAEAHRYRRGNCRRNRPP